MSPECYKRVKTKEEKFKFDGLKNDSFSLGMTLLELAIQ